MVFTTLFIGGIAISTAMAGGDTFPSPFGSSAPDPGLLPRPPGRGAGKRVPAVRRLGPMAIYAATTSARLRNLGIRVPGATIALVGGVLAAAMLGLSGVFTWVLSRPEVLDDPAVVRALQDLAFATGGTGHVVFLGLLTAGIAVPGLLAGLLPRRLALIGLVIAAVAELSTLTLLVSDAAILLPIARFTALAWLIATGFVLPPGSRPPWTSIVDAPGTDGRRRRREPAPRRGRR
jgi:hypothetical protein